MNIEIAESAWEPKADHLRPKKFKPQMAKRSEGSSKAEEMVKVA